MRFWELAELGERLESTTKSPGEVDTLGRVREICARQMKKHR